MLGSPQPDALAPMDCCHLYKHVVKVISLSQGYTDAQIILALGTRAGTIMQGLDKLHSNTRLPFADSWTLKLFLPNLITYSRLSADTMAVGDTEKCCNVQQCTCLDTDF